MVHHQDHLYPKWADGQTERQLGSQTGRKIVKEGLGVWAFERKLHGRIGYALCVHWTLSLLSHILQSWHTTSPGLRVVYVT